MKDILVPIDFSVHAISAAETGAYIARKTKATLHLVHIVKAPEDWEILTEAQQSRAPELQARVAEAENKTKIFSELPMFESVTVIPRVFAGVPFKFLQGYIEQHKIDLIVMGAHGESAPLFIGSTAQKILRSVNCPVLSVKKDFKPVSLKRILFASDFSEPGIKKSIKVVARLAESLNAKLDFVFINTPARFADTASIEKRMAAFEPVMNTRRRKMFVYNDYTSEQGILNVARKLKINVIALATHNRRNKHNYQLGVTETLLFHSSLPVLSVVM
jgi:nucleotide-binding universal stress UspA family protein